MCPFDGALQGFAFSKVPLQLARAAQSCWKRLVRNEVVKEGKPRVLWRALRAAGDGDTGATLPLLCIRAACCLSPSQRVFLLALGHSITAFLQGKATLVLEHGDVTSAQGQPRAEGCHVLLANRDGCHRAKGNRMG